MLELGFQIGLISLFETNLTLIQHFPVLENQSDEEIDRHVMIKLIDCKLCTFFFFHNLFNLFFHQLSSNRVEKLDEVDEEDLVEKDLVEKDLVEEDLVEEWDYQFDCYSRKK